MAFKLDPLNIFYKTFIFITSIILLIFFILLITILSPIYIFRFIIFKSSKFLRPDLGKMLTTRSTLTGIDDTYVSPQCVIFAAYSGTGILDLETFRKRSIEIINSRDDNGDLKYSELHQYISSWLGFLFWKWDKNFDLSHHLKYQNENGELELSESELPKFFAKIVREPFKEGKSPWEVILIPNYKPNNKSSNPQVKHFLIVIRISHALADGYSCYKLLFRELFKDSVSYETLVKPTTLKKQMSTWKRAIFMILTLLKMPFEFTKTILSPLDKNHGWRKGENQITGKLRFGIGPNKDINYFKDIKTAHKVSLTSVLIAGICGGIRRMMIEQNHQLPKFVNFSCPFPMPNHPDDKLRNHMTLCMITLPIGEEDPLKRLKIIDKQFKAVSYSSIPLLMFYLWKLIGGLFTFMVKAIAKSKLSTGLVSNLPGPATPFYYEGLKIDDGFFNGGLLRGDIGIVFTTPSYSEKMRITVMADSSIIQSDTEMNQLINFVELEFSTLKNLADV